MEYSRIGDDYFSLRYYDIFWNGYLIVSITSIGGRISKDISIFIHWTFLQFLTVLTGIKLA